MEKPSLERSYSVNDRIIRHKTLDDHFFVETFFSTKKAKKSSSGSVHYQLFVTEKGFINVAPMRSKSEAMLAMKQFAKDIEAREAVITDSTREEKYQEVKKFLNRIETTLRVFQEGNPWSNRTELCVGILKETFAKQTKETDFLLAL